MINLKELARKLDQALESETAESLTQWLSERKTSNIKSYVGAGEVVSCLMPIQEEGIGNGFVCLTDEENEQNKGNTTYAMAA